MASSLAPAPGLATRPGPSALTESHYGIALTRCLQSCVGVSGAGSTR
jgi:hypothetical protein